MWTLSCIRVVRCFQIDLYYYHWGDQEALPGCTDKNHFAPTLHCAFKDYMYMYQYFVWNTKFVQLLKHLSVVGLTLLNFRKHQLVSWNLPHLQNCLWSTSYAYIVCRRKNLNCVKAIKQCWYPLRAPHLHSDSNLYTCDALLISKSQSVYNVITVYPLILSSFVLSSLQIHHIIHLCSFLSFCTYI